jgi:dCMP deaminase
MSWWKDFDWKRDVVDPIEKQKVINRFYCGIAIEFSKLSKDPRLKVGCVIVTPEGIVYPGYNGDEKGGDNVHDSPEPGQSGFIHAEENAIIKFNPTIHKGSKMYLSHSPCKMCARRIVNTCAIIEVYYNIEYRIRDGIELLEKRGIPCKRVDL